MTLLATSPLRKHLKLSDESDSSIIVPLIGSLLQSTSEAHHSLIAILDSRIATLEKQKLRCNGVIAILEEAGGIAVRVRNFVMTPDDCTKHHDKIQEQEKVFITTVQKLDKTVASAEDDGINLLAGQSLTTDFGGGQALITQGIPLDSQSLGIRPPDFSSFINVQNARIDVMNAMDMVVTLRNSIAIDAVNLSIGRDVARQSIDCATSAQHGLQTTTTIKEIAALGALIAQKNTNDEPLAEPAQQDILTAFAVTPHLPPKTED